MLFHPGTTDTPLSKFFSKNVPADKLFTPDFVAERLLAVSEQYAVPGELSFIDWQANRLILKRYCKFTPFHYFRPI